MADVTALDVLGVPVYQAVRPASRNLAVSQGKGATAAAARVSAVMEGFELWHAEDLDAVPQVTVSVGEMQALFFGEARSVLRSESFFERGMHFG